MSRGVIILAGKCPVRNRSTCGESDLANECQSKHYTVEGLRVLRKNPNHMLHIPPLEAKSGNKPRHSFDKHVPAQRCGEVKPSRHEDAADSQTNCARNTLMHRRSGEVRGRGLDDLMMDGGPKGFREQRRKRR